MGSLSLAHALAGDTAKARAAYQDFFTLWKDADPDIPILLGRFFLPVEPVPQSSV